MRINGDSPARNSLLRSEALLGLIMQNIDIRKSQYGINPLRSTVWGSAGDHTEIHDVFTLLKNLKEKGNYIPRLYTCCGTEDRRHQDSVDLKKTADELDVPLLFEQGPGRHDDIFFDEYIQKILNWMNFAGEPIEE